MTAAKKSDSKATIYSLRKKASWWRDQIEAGKRTNKDMEEWLIESNLDAEEVGRFQFYYQHPQAHPWEVWQSPEKVKHRYGKG